MSERTAEPNYPPEKLEAFLDELTELSRKYGLGIGEGELWLMESGPDSDYTRTYSSDDESKLLFV